MTHYSTGKEIRIGVVGIGHLGNYHLQKYQKMEDCKIAGVVDVVEERARKAAELYKCDPFSHHRELIGKVDAVSVAVPTVSHYTVARDLLDAGIHLLLEKPIAVTLEEADELINLAEKRNVIFQIGFIERFNPAIIALRNLMDRPLFIEAHRLHPFFERGTDVDVILDLMIHDLDIILQFVKSPVSHVDAVGVSVLSDKVDIANARISFHSGCVANITASRITGKVMQKIRFFGLNGYHAVDYHKREIVSLSKTHNAQGKVEIISNPVEIILNDPLEEEIRSFINAIIHRTKPPVTGKEGRDALELAIIINNEIKKNQKLLA